jgi:hypothetical protein
VGPYFLPQRLIGAVDPHFLRNALPELLQDVDLQTRIHLWFMYYGVPPHSLAAVRDFFNGVFLQQWIGREGPTALTARPSVVNVLDFCLWCNGPLACTISASDCITVLCVVYYK